MKLTNLLVSLLLISSSSFAQTSTCKSRCEERLGFGDQRCPDICRNVKDEQTTPSRKKNPPETNPSMQSPEAAKQEKTMPIPVANQNTKQAESTTSTTEPAKK